jgi:predicted NACHT family NTPase
VPAGTPVVKLFDDLDGKLLILGTPGSGKTTLLLELAHDLISRARSDPQHPLPLAFNLSTWASKRLPLKDWLAEELNQRYDIEQVQRGA